MGKLPLLRIIVGVGIIVLAIVAIFMIVNRPIVQETTVIKGPDRIEDASQTFSLQIPRGWYGQAGEGAINIQNYNSEKIVLEHGSPLNLPEDHVKMEVYVFELSDGQTFEQWLSVERSGASVQKEEDYALGTYHGVTYSTEFTWVAAFLICDDKGILANMFPRDSVATEDALRILTTIQVNTAEKSCY